MEGKTYYEVEDLSKILLDKEFFTRYENLNKLVLFLGSTGKGKSSTTEILRGSQQLRAEGEYGEYLIVDTKDCISARGSTILSKTTFPNPIWYEGMPKDTYCLDCPGFEDTRNTAMDILCTVSTAEALKDCHSVKIVLILSYDDVKEGGERKAFTNLVKLVSKFIRSLDKFNESIALVVTKVPNLPILDKDKNISFVSDEIMKEKVIKFLLNVRATILSQVNRVDEHRHTYQCALKLINMILPKAGSTNDMSRIALIRCPSEPGLISQMPQYQTSRANLHKLIQNILTFAKVDRSDFHCIVSPDSELYLLKVIDDQVSSMSKTLKETFNRFQNYYDNCGDNEIEIDKISKQITSDCKLWQDTASKMQELKYVPEIMKYLLEQLHLLPDLIPGERSKLKEEIGNFLWLADMQERVTTRKCNATILDWLMLVLDIAKKVKNLNLWYSVLPNIYKLFTSYEFHRRKESARKEISLFLGKLRNWVKTDKNKLISGTEVQYAIKELCGQNLGYNLEFGISPKKLERILGLSEFASKATSTAEDGKRCRITGNYVMLSEALQWIGKGKQVEIIGVAKVFIDCDIEATGLELKIAIIAPVWEVIDKSLNIILDGENGDSTITGQKRRKEKIEEGCNGKPGLPGGCGGHFIGIGKKVYNGKSLCISVNGGQGSTGQIGGDGEDGEDGSDAKVPNDEERWAYADPPFTFQPDRSKSFSCEYLIGLTLLRRALKQERKRYGTEGSAGEDGGDGGKGGIGGFQGKVLLLGLEESLFGCVTSNPGLPGANGIGGHGGTGGRNGSDVTFIAIWNEHLLYLLDMREYLECRIVGKHNNGRKANGKKGVDGGNNLDQKAPNINEFVYPLPIKEYLLIYDNVDPVTPLEIQSSFRRILSDATST